MNARDKIFASIVAGKPALARLPDLAFTSAAERNAERLAAEFIRVLTAIGATVTETTLSRLKQDLEKATPDGSQVVNTDPAIGPVDDNVSPGSTALALQGIEKAYIRGTIGVAENGAIWLSEADMVNRLLPFICQHLVIVLDRRDIVPDLHEAYRALQPAQSDGYGVFIAGPSRTADIEQSLVTGAHGARSCLVYLVIPETHP
jgi:L-lactate dehydrogenase complex protein LldG